MVEEGREGKRGSRLGISQITGYGLEHTEGREGGEGQTRVVVTFCSMSFLIYRKRSTGVKELVCARRDFRFFSAHESYYPSCFVLLTILLECLLRVLEGVRLMIAMLQGMCWRRRRRRRRMRVRRRGGERGGGGGG